MRIKKKKLLTDHVISKNDNIDELNNNKGYATKQEVEEIVAKKVTAEFIQALNANFSQAQIDSLEAGTVKVKAMTSDMVKVLDADGNVLFYASQEGINRLVNIAGWSVTSEELDGPLVGTGTNKHPNVALYTGQNKVFPSLVSSGNSPVRFMAGHNVPNNAKFLVLDDGSCYAKKFKILGTHTHQGDSRVTDMDLTDGYILTKYPVYRKQGQSENYYYIVQNIFNFNGRVWYHFIRLTGQTEHGVVTPGASGKSYYFDSENTVSFICDELYVNRNLVSYDWNESFYSYS